MSSILKNRRIQIALVALLLLGILPLMFKGLQFGMDFKGGTLIQINLDISENETVDVSTVINVIETRLNAFGLKDVSVKPFGENYIIIEIAETDPDAINELQSILGQQGKFETLFEGEAILKGEDIVNVIADPQQGYGFRPSAYGYRWTVPFLITSEASQNFADSLNGVCSTPYAETCPEILYMFIDRPEGAVILMPEEIYNNEKTIPDDLDQSPNLIPVDDLTLNSGVELIVTDTIDAQTIQEITGKTVIIPPNYFSESELEQYAEKVLTKEQTGDYWVVSALNLENIVHVTPGIAAGAPVSRPSITGSALSEEQAVKELNRVVILLKSGKLPVSVSVGSISTISPVLGEEFLRYSLYAGIFAIATVISFLLIRYRRIKIAGPISITMLLEIILILGIAAAIGWQIDLPAVAGLIAAVGVGVDHQVLITDEILRKEEDTDDQLSTAAKIKKAFSIIMMSASTTIFAMLPLLFVGLGALKGFAITTIIGILIGVFITRPAFAVLIRKVL